MNSTLFFRDTIIWHREYFSTRTKIDESLFGIDLYKLLERECSKLLQKPFRNEKYNESVLVDCNDEFWRKNNIKYKIDNAQIVYRSRVNGSLINLSLHDILSYQQHLSFIVYPVFMLNDVQQINLSCTQFTVLQNKKRILSISVEKLYQYYEQIYWQNWHGLWIYGLTESNYEQYKNILLKIENFNLTHKIISLDSQDINYCKKQISSLNTYIIDDIYPYKLAQQGKALFYNEDLNKHYEIDLRQNEFNTINNNCSCAVCAHYDYRYIHHLLNVGEYQAIVLLQKHNYFCYQQIFSK